LEHWRIEGLASMAHIIELNAEAGTDRLLGAHVLTALTFSKDVARLSCCAS